MRQAESTGRSGTRPETAHAKAEQPASRGGLGRRTVHRARWTVALACLLGCVASLYALGVADRLSPGGWQPAGAESLRADALLGDEFHVGAPQLVLLARTAGSVDDPAAATAGRELIRQLSADGRTAWVRGYWQRSDPELRADDGRSALVTVRLEGDEAAVHAAGDDLLARYAGRAGPLRISGSGEAAVMSETERLSENGLRLAELVAVPLVLMILLWSLGSAVAALVPLITGVVTVCTAMALLRLLSEFTSVSVFALNITVALGFGLAVDYSLLLIKRYWEELSQGHAPGPALRRTMRGAGRTVVFSAATVGASLCALLVFPLPFLRSLAYGGTAVVGVSALMALTVLPALLIVFGDRIERYDVFARLRRHNTGPAPGAWYRLARWVMRRPVTVTAAVLAVLALLAAPVFQVRFGMYDERAMPDSSPVARATRQLRAEYGPDVLGAASVVLPRLSAERSGAELDGYACRLSAVAGVRQVDAATGTYRHGRRAAPPTARSARFTGPAGSWLSVSAGPHRPLTPEGSRLAGRLRKVPAPVPALVGGLSAQLADTERVLVSRLPAAVALTVLTTFVLLLCFTRSLLIPLKALVLNALGLAATAGVLVAVFQEGLLAPVLGGATATGVTDVIVPGLMFCVAFGLSMDYEVFLLSRIVDEHRRGSDTMTAIAAGLQRTGPLFTAAALVFASVMGALALSSLILLKLIGTGLALAVLLDCTVIRALLVPAVMRLAGEANWWTPRLGRRRVTPAVVVTAARRESSS